MKIIITLIHLLLTLAANAQNFGINTSAPQAPLHVINPDTKGGEIVRLEGASPYIGFYNSAGTYTGYLWNKMNISMEVGTPAGTTFPVTIAPARNIIASFLPSGNVGIGLNNPHPDAVLHVELNASMSKGFLVRGNFHPSATVPDLGAGARMMFYPGKAAFRAGIVGGSQWNNENVGFHSVAMGYDAIANAANTIAIGTGTVASGPYSLALGDRSSASGQNSTAIGARTIASGLGSVALGFSTVASNMGSTSMGRYTLASGFEATAMGYDTWARGPQSTAMGYLTVAGGGFSTAMGQGTVSKFNACTVVGRFNDSLTLEDDGLPPHTPPITTAIAPLFIVGNGIAPESRSNAFLVRRDGNVGIGTNSPLQRLQVVGNICHSGAVLACSDIRYKTDFAPLETSLQAVLKMEPFFYRWKEDLQKKGFDSDRHLGFSAQAIEQLFPDLVQTNSDGYKAVDYGRLTVVLVQAIKEQQVLLEETKKEMTEFKHLLNSMRQHEIVTKK